MMRNKKVVFLACNANKSVAKRMPNFTKRGEELGSGRKRYRRMEFIHSAITARMGWWRWPQILTCLGM